MPASRTGRPWASPHRCGRPAAGGCSRRWRRGCPARTWRPTSAPPRPSLPASRRSQAGRRFGSSCRPAWQPAPCPRRSRGRCRAIRSCSPRPASSSCRDGPAGCRRSAAVSRGAPSRSSPSSPARHRSRGRHVPSTAGSGLDQPRSGSPGRSASRRSRGRSPDRRRRVRCRGVLSPRYGSSAGCSAAGWWRFASARHREHASLARRGLVRRRAPRRQSDHCSPEWRAR